MSQEYSKPFLLTEYGPGHHGGWIGEDPGGVIVHNGLWGSVVSGAAGSAMPWGSYNWIDPQDFYRYWRPLSGFVKGIPFHERTWQPATVDSFVFAEGGARPHYAGAFLEGWPRNYNYTLCGPAPDEYAVTVDGELEDQASLPGVLKAGHEQRFRLECPVDGELVVHVPEVSADGAAILEVAIDDETALTQPLTIGEEEAWAYWRSYPVPLPEGSHVVTVRNAGKGTLWTGFELTRLRRREGPDLDVYGMQCEETILLWLRNPQFIWVYQREGRGVAPQTAGTLTLLGIADGTYRVSWVDTVSGEALGEAEVTAADGTLVLQTPPITCSAAARVDKLNQP